MVSLIQEDSGWKLNQYSHWLNTISLSVKHSILGLWTHFFKWLITHNILAFMHIWCDSWNLHPQNVCHNVHVRSLALYPSHFTLFCRAMCCQKSQVGLTSSPFPRKFLPSHNYHHALVIPILPITSRMKYNMYKTPRSLLCWEFLLWLCPMQSFCDSNNVLLSTLVPMSPHDPPTQDIKNHYVPYSNTIVTDWLGSNVQWCNQEGAGRDTEHRIDNDWWIKSPPIPTQTNQKKW